jgi:replicative DNA helicase
MTKRESDLIGCVLSDVNALYDCMEHRLQPGDFEDPYLGKLYELCCLIYRRTQALNSLDVYEAVGKSAPMVYPDLPTVIALTDTAPPSASAPSYVEHVMHEARRRRMLDKLSEAQEQARTWVGPFESLVGTLTAELHSVEVLGRPTEDTSLQAAVSKVVRRAEDDVLGEGDEYRVSYGFGAVDHLVGSVLPGELHIIGARTSMGKTALGVDVLERLAEDMRARGVDGQLLLYSLEDSPEGIGRRIITRRARVGARDLRSGDVNMMQLESLQFAEDNIATTIGEIIHVIKAQTVEAIEADVARRKRLGVDVRLVMVDYLQLVKGDDKKPRHLQVGAISQGLKDLGHRQQVPVMAMAQVNRGGMDRKDKRPKLSDLRESGSLEQDADAVLFVHRPDYYDPEAGPATTGLAEVIVAKNRHGQTGIAELEFRGGHFYDLIEP